MAGSYTGWFTKMLHNPFGSGRLAEVLAGLKSKRLFWASLSVSLVPTLRLFQVALQDADPSLNLAGLSLPVTLFCVARLLTEGAYRRSNVGQETARHQRSVGYARAFALAVVLGVLFIFSFYCGIFAAYTLVPRWVAAVTAFAFTFPSALGISRFLLHFWGFVVGPPKGPRVIAAAVLGLTAALWIFSCSQGRLFG